MYTRIYNPEMGSKSAKYGIWVSAFLPTKLTRPPFRPKHFLKNMLYYIQKHWLCNAAIGK